MRPLTNRLVNPLMRQLVGRGLLGPDWALLETRSGVAHVVAEADPYALMRRLRRPLNDAMLLAVGTEQLVIRIDLGPWSDVEPRRSVTPFGR